MICIQNRHWQSIQIDLHHHSIYCFPVLLFKHNSGILSKKTVLISGHALKQSCSLRTQSGFRSLEVVLGVDYKVTDKSKPFSKIQGRLNPTCSTSVSKPGTDSPRHRIKLLFIKTNIHNINIYARVCLSFLWRPVQIYNIFNFLSSSLNKLHSPFKE